VTGLPFNAVVSFESPFDARVWRALGFAGGDLGQGDTPLLARVWRSGGWD